MVDMSFFKELEDSFGTKCLYEALNVTKDADEKQLKKAYHKMSLKYHPDRVSEENKENSKVKFQMLAKVYSILSDKEQRSVYDETGGLVDENDILTQNRDWESYWRVLFKKITQEDIERFEKEYKGTDEEEKDVKAYYLQFEGNIEEILDNVLCSTEEDEERFREIIQKSIDNGELPSFDRFAKVDEKKRRKRKKKAVREAEEAAEHAKDLGIDADADLKQLILKRNANREVQMNNLFDNLEAKYCKPKQKKTSSKASNKATSTKRKRK